MKLLLMLIIPTCLFGQTQSLDLLTGTWVSQQDNGGITRIAIRKDGTRTLVHAWGSCHPLDCDWGDAEANAWNAIPVAIWKQGFATTRVQLIPVPDGRMIAASDTEFGDGSGRTDPGSVDFFRRIEVKSESSASLEAKAVLRETANTYRNLGSAYFEALSTSTRTVGKSEVRTVMREKIFVASPNKTRVEFEGSGEGYVLIDDGVSQWRVYPNANEYETNPQPQRPIPDGPISKYVLLDNVRGDPRIVGAGEVQGTDCSMVTIAMDHGVTERLWIDDASHLVRKDVTDEGSSTEEELFTTVHLGETMPSGAFIYDPVANHAKNRIELARQAPESMIGSSAPGFRLHDLNDDHVDLGALRGKPILLDFWATWCEYCLEGLPSIELLHRAFKNKLAVLGIDNEEPEIAREYLRKYSYTFASLVDRRDEAVNLYHVNAWPTTVLIDRGGRIVFYGHDFDSEKLRDALRSVGVW
jgi:cytochrome c biogenesis protein CcmG, thiol:disulfide interchange protein DsbE